MPEDGIVNEDGERFHRRHDVCVVFVRFVDPVYDTVCVGPSGSRVERVQEALMHLVCEV